MEVILAVSAFSIVFCPLTTDISRWLPPSMLWRRP
jgi:hypothetical protein